MKKILYLIAAGILVLGCKLLSPTPTVPTESTFVDCSSLEITDAYVQAARQYGNGILSEDEWAYNYNVSSKYVIVSYINNGIHARIEFISTIFCDAKDTLKTNLNDVYFNDFFLAYDSYSIVDSCEKDNTILYQASAVYQNANYSVRAWFEPLDDNHVKVTTLYFPEADTENFDFYSNAYFPNFTSCK